MSLPKVSIRGTRYKRAPLFWEIEPATKAGENLSLNEVLDLAEGHFITAE